MKMENEIKSPVEGILTEISVAEGQTVESGALLFVVTPPERRQASSPARRCCSTPTSEATSTMRWRSVSCSPSRTFDLVAVTTVCGDTRLARAHRGAPARRSRVASRVDVCAGEEAPILRAENRFVWFGHETDPLPDGPDAQPLRRMGARADRAGGAGAPGLELLAIGPLTNVARALALDPKLPRRWPGSP